MERTLEIPEDVDIAVEAGEVTVSSGDTEVVKRLDEPDVSIDVEGDRVVVTPQAERRNVQALAGTYAAHIRNMIVGVTQGYEYVMKGFYQHFPMDMAVEGDEFVISNFIGERTPRRIAIPDGVSVNVDGEDVTVTGADKEAVSQTAANIEQACYKGNRDPRKFQDGIYITEKRVVNDE